MADRKKLERALANIIDNAIKYTGSGGTVDLLVKKDTGVCIEVRDSGCGIDKSEQQKIFKRFYRSDNSRSTTGSGLGLSLADAVVRAHSGRIVVESEVSKGSCFSIQLPS